MASPEPLVGASQLIDEIRIELDRLTRTVPTDASTGQWPESRWAPNKLAKQKHADLPRIEWEEVGGTIDLSARGARTGGVSGGIGTDFATFRVTVWHDSMANCRITLCNLILAARGAVDGPNVQFGSYEWIDDAETKKGRKLTVPVRLSLPVPAEVSPTVSLESTSHQVLVGGQVVC